MCFIQVWYNVGSHETGCSNISRLSDDTGYRILQDNFEYYFVTKARDYKTHQSEYS